MNNGLFLPLEVVKREYLGRLCLAVEMAARGTPVFIGHKKWIIRLALQARDPGIFFYKDAAKDEWFVPALEEKGFGLVAQDEEAGIIYADFDEFYKRRRSLDNIPNLDLFFSWGSDDYSYLRDRFCGQASCNIRNTGAIKTIFWGPQGRRYFEAEIDRIKQRYGRYVIFITNFAVSNSYLPGEDLLQLGVKNDANVEESYGQRNEKESRLMRFVVLAAEQIAGQTDLTVVVRPHPTESVDNWRRATVNLKNVFVEPEGDLSPWILGSEGVLHNSCTSGIQAAASGVPVVAFGEKNSDLAGTCPIPNDVSIPAIGIGPLLETVGNLDACWREVESTRQEVLEKKLSGVGTLSPLTDTADALLQLSGTPNPTGNRDLGRDSIMYDLKEVYRTSRLRSRSRRRILDQNKRPTIKKRDIRRDVANIGKLLGYGQDFEVGRVGRNSYRIRCTSRR